MQIQSVDIFTLKNWLDNDQAVIIDVREIEEYNNDHIKDAFNIPLSQIIENIEKIKSFFDKKIILQCRVGVRSMSACKILFDSGFEFDVYNLEGGINAWRNSGF